MQEKKTQLGNTVVGNFVFPVNFGYVYTLICDSSGL